MKMQSILIAVLLTVFGGAVHAQEFEAPENDSQMDEQRIVPADEMTCDQAVAYYAKYKMIYKRVINGTDIVPIYGMQPVSEWRKVVCRGRNKVRQHYWLKTRDSKMCVIAVFCA